MAHASSREKAELQMKKVRKNKARKKQDESKIRAEMTEEEYAEYCLNKSTKSLKEQAQTALYDYGKNQYPFFKYRVLADLLTKRKDEIIRTEEKFAEEELKQLEVTLHELRIEP